MARARTGTAFHSTISNKEAKRTGVRGRVKKFREAAATERAVNMSRPGPRGWRGPRSGRATRVEAPVEYRGTSVQVCGLWPFAAGSGAPVVGAPLGMHLHNPQWVCGDPVSLFVANLILNPSAFVLGRPGLGKSTLVRRIITILAGWGITPMILSDTKPDYPDLIRALRGQVISVGRGLSHINPLDPGPLMEVVDQLPDDMKRKVLAEIRGVQLNTLTGLIELVRNHAITETESTLLSTALRLLDAEGVTVPLISDVQRMIQVQEDASGQLTAHPSLRNVAQDRGEISRYQDRTEALVSALIALGPDGPFDDVFAHHTTHPIPMDGRAVCFDMSSVDDSDLKMQAALQLVCWSYGSSAVGTAKYLAQAGLAPERVYILIMDELWRMLRAAEAMVYRVDALTRLNRQRLLAQMMITHTMNDLDMGTEKLTSIARGFVERSGMLYLGGLAESEMGNLAAVFNLTARERQMLTDWSPESGVDPISGRASAPPGQGNFLLKRGKKPGTPLKVELTDLELQVNDTNQRWAELRRGETVKDVA